MPKLFEKKSRRGLNFKKSWVIIKIPVNTSDFESPCIIFKKFRVEKDFQGTSNQNTTLSNDISNVCIKNEKEEHTNTRDEPIKLEDMSIDENNIKLEDSSEDDVLKNRSDLKNEEDCLVKSEVNENNENVIEIEDSSSEIKTYNERRFDYSENLSYTNLIPKELQCLYCLFQCDEKSTLKDHKINKHKYKKINFICKKCEFTASTPHALTCHIALKHEKNKTEYLYGCKICPFLAQNFTQAAIHLCTVHANYNLQTDYIKIQPL